MFIVYQEKKGIEYATLTKSIRKGATVSKEYINLGRVIDKEKGVYQNRKRGVFTYDPKTDEYGICPEDIIPPKVVKRGEYYTIGSFKSWQDVDHIFYFILLLSYKHTPNYNILVK